MLNINFEICKNFHTLFALIYNIINFLDFFLKFIKFFTRHF